MNNSAGLRPPPRPRSPSGQRSQSSISQRSESEVSIDSSDSSQLTSMSVTKRAHPLQQQQQQQQYFNASTQSLGRPSTTGGAAASPPIRNVPSSQNLSRSNLRTSVDGSNRLPSPSMASSAFSALGHRARQHSQGFFEPSLPNVNSSGLSASQIAAQAAMHTISPPSSAMQQERKRSMPQGLAQINTSYFPPRRPSETQTPQTTASAAPLGYSNGLIGGSRLAATTAANAAFPNTRSITPSPPGLGGTAATQAAPPFAPQTGKETKVKSSKMKLFSKPKNLNLSRDKETKIAAPGVSSPGKNVIGAHVYRGGLGLNASVTSLAEPSSTAGSLYSSVNASTSTLVPTSTTVEKDKDKYRHNFLSRSKHKLKDDQAALPLSSANSNSQAVNPDRPQPLYSFTPDSPSTTSFAKTMSGFDLRHGGRALREKKKEGKAAAAAAAKFEAATLYANQSYNDRTEPFAFNSTADTGFGPASTGTLPSNSFPFVDASTPTVSAVAISNIGTIMGVPGLGPDDIWPLLKARLLNLFSGESLVRPVEELNILVSSHVERCIRRKLPLVLIEDLRELVTTGFGSLAQTLRMTPDDRLVNKLVDMWVNVYGAIVPFLQAVFLPLDMEFKGKGAYMTVTQAQEFWAAMPENYKSDDRPTSSGSSPAALPKLGDELDVRRVTLIAFRDTVILPKHEILMAIFSRLSLGSINASASPIIDGQARNHSRSDPAHPGAERPDTAGSLSPHMSSYNSQASTLLDASSTSSGGGGAAGGSMSLANRSRATSNTSAGSFGTSLPRLLSGSLPTQSHAPSPNPQLSPLPILTDPAKVTETVARMLQCLYVLASCQTGDVGQGVVERLTVALKYNWLGRGRTGRDRRGWVGVKTGQQSRVGLVGA